MNLYKLFYFFELLSKIVIRKVYCVFFGILLRDNDNIFIKILTFSF